MSYYFTCQNGTSCLCQGHNCCAQSWVHLGTSLRKDPLDVEDYAVDAAKLHEEHQEHNNSEGLAVTRICQQCFQRDLFYGPLIQKF